MGPTQPNMAKRQGLTPKQRQFVREYLVDLNATKAAIRAGYSEQWANKIGPRLVGKSRFRRAIREAMEVRAAKTELTAEQVIREIKLLAFSNHSDYQVDDSGAMKLRPHADPGALRAISSIERTYRTHGKGDDKETEVKVKYRLWDKPSSLKLLCEHLGILKAPELPPLEALLAALPAELRGRIRQLLAKPVSE